MLGKLIVHGEDRQEAIRKTLSALDAFAVSGIATTLPLSRAIVGDADFARSAVTTDWLERIFLPHYMVRSEAAA
jgi:biotin carboxylase